MRAPAVAPAAAALMKDGDSAMGARDARAVPPLVPPESLLRLLLLLDFLSLLLFSLLLMSRASKAGEQPNLPPVLVSAFSRFSAQGIC